MIEKGVIANLLPGTAFSLRENYAPGRKMIDSGLNVALATDCNPGSCNTESMPIIITLACLNMKFTTAEALTAATINAAKSLLIDEKVGSIEKNKLADIVIWDMPSYKTLPYHFGINLVDKVIKKGKIVITK